MYKDKHIPKDMVSFMRMELTGIKDMASFCLVGIIWNHDIWLEAKNLEKCFQKVFLNYFNSASTDKTKAKPYFSTY